MSFDLELEGRRALVTGGTKGIGAAVVDVLSKQAVKVITVARTVPSVSPDGVAYIAADITTAEGCSAVVRAVFEQFGGIDILINVLGGSKAPGGGFAALDDDEWSKELNLNLMLAVRLDRGLLPSMISQGTGVIVHVTSIQHVLPCRSRRRPMLPPKLHYLPTVRAYRRRSHQRAFGSCGSRPVGWKRRPR